MARAKEGEVAFGKHTKRPKRPECGRPMEYYEFPVMSAVDVEHQVQPPLWLCRHCWRVVCARQASPERAGHRARPA
jgi:hypothetical protein